MFPVFFLTGIYMLLFSTHVVTCSNKIVDPFCRLCQLEVEDVRHTVTWRPAFRSIRAFILFVRLSLLTMTNPNQLCDVLLFVCSKMADETHLSSKLPVADRTREVCGRKLCWWCLSSGFPLCTFLLGFADSFCFLFTSSLSYEASQLFDPVQSVPRLCWYVEVFKGGLESVLVSLLLITMGAFSNL